MEPGVPFSILQIVGDPGIGKSWLLDQIRYELENEQAGNGTDQKPVMIIQIDFRHDRDAQAINTLRFIRLLRDRFLFVGEQLEPVFHLLTQTVNRYADPKKGIESFFENISAAFEYEELSVFVNEQLKIDYDKEIAGDNLLNRVFNLIQYLDRRNDLARLTDKLQQFRPLINWDIGERLKADSQTEYQFALRQINKALTDALTNVLKDYSHILILLDSVEEAGDEIKEWLTADFFSWLRSDEADAVTLLFTEQSLKSSTIPGTRDILKKFPLEKLEKKYVIEYFQERRNLNLDAERLELLFAENVGMQDVHIPRIMHNLAVEIELELNDAPDPFWDDL